MALIRVALADDHQLVLDTVRELLEADGDFEVVAASVSAEHLLSALGRECADVVVLDVRMPRVDGLSCLRSIRDRHPHAKVVMLSGLEDPRTVRRALELGASAFVRKDVDPQDLAGVLRHVLEETVVSWPPASHDPDDELEEVRSLLTPSEFGVLAALARGLVNKEIATELGISQQTVKFHLTNVYRKLGVTNRTEAIAFAFEHGVAETPFAAV